jgi:hypothetical protein
MMRRGVCWELPTLERRTSGSDGGVWLPTPSAKPYGTNKGGAAGRVGKERPSLETMGKRGWIPTPVASDSKKSRRVGLAPNSHSGRTQLDWIIETTGRGGPINPAWRSWLMGWPIGATALEPLAMDGFLLWLQRHGIYSESD